MITLTLDGTTLQATTTKETTMREEAHLPDPTKMKAEAEAEEEAVKEEEEVLQEHASSATKRVTWLEIVQTLIRDKVAEVEVVLQELAVTTSASSVENLAISLENALTLHKTKEIVAEEEDEAEALVQ